MKVRILIKCEATWGVEVTMTKKQFVEWRKRLHQAKRHEVDTVAFEAAEEFDIDIGPSLANFGGLTVETFEPVE